MTQSSAVASGLRVHRGFSAEDRDAVAEIFADAFVDKLKGAADNRDEALRVLTPGLRPERVLVALRGGEVVGVCGLCYAGIQFAHVDYATLKEEFGSMSAVWRLLRLTFLARTPTPAEMLVDGLAVRSDCRGQGIGTVLLQALMKETVRLGYRQVELDVAADNPAKDLYLRNGFTDTGTFTRPPFSRRRFLRLVRVVRGE